MDIEKLKQANQIYETLADKSSEDAFNQLKTYQGLDQEVLKLIKSLINNSHQHNTYFEQKISQLY